MDWALALNSFCFDSRSILVLSLWTDEGEMRLCLLPSHGGGLACIDGVPEGPRALPG